MSAKHKIITEVVNNTGQASRLSEALNAEASHGWRVQQISTGTYRRRGEYHADTHSVVLVKTEAHFEYICVFQARTLPIASASEKPGLNDAIDEQERNGYSLALLTQTTVVNPDQDRPASKNCGHLLIFERAL